MGLRILIMGLPGAGKTTLAQAIMKQLGDCLWLNADKIRELHNDWDFSYAGRLRQATRMKRYADISEDRYVIADFVCPLPEMRDIFQPDFLIWVDTIKTGRFENTNKLFVPPEKFDIRVTEHDAKWLNLVLLSIKNVDCHLSG